MNAPKQFGQWTVYGTGLMVSDNGYDIAPGELNHTDWISHMSEKNWVNMDDFIQAYRYALMCNRSKLYRPIAR